MILSLFQRSVAFFLFILFSGVSSQLVGCDAVDCPTVNNTVQCVVGNTTSLAVGIASLNVSETISSKPLSWTVGVQQLDDPTNNSQALFDRNYFLGTPSSLDLDNAKNLSGCALFFEGVTGTLTFPGNNSDTSIGTCDDALSPMCVTDLVSQAKSSFSKLLAGEDSSVCIQLQKELQKSAPGSCRAAQNGSWGNVLARDLTGPNASHPIILDQCHPTLGKDDELMLVASNRQASVRDIVHMKSILSGITPILTLFASTSADSQPELTLTCVKALASTKNQTKDDSSGSTLLRANIGVTAAVMGFVVLMVANFS